MKEIVAGLAVAILIAIGLSTFAQTPSDDLAQALAKHGMDSTTAPVAAAAIEIIIANNNALLTRLTNDEAAIATLKQQVAALQPAAPPPAPATLYALEYSPNADRSAAILLNGATLKGAAYVFTGSTTNLQNLTPSGAASVCYWLDNPTSTQSPMHCEGTAPWDFIGGTATAYPWDTTTLPNGPHTITQRVTTSSGSVEATTAAFTVAN